MNERNSVPRILEGNLLKEGQGWGSLLVLDPYSRRKKGKERSVSAEYLPCRFMHRRAPTCGGNSTLSVFTPGSDSVF